MMPDISDETQSLDGYDKGSDRPRISQLGHFRIEATLGGGWTNDAIAALEKALSTCDCNRFYSIDEAVTAHYCL